MSKLTRRGLFPAVASTAAMAAAVGGLTPALVQAAEVSDLIEIPTDELLALRQRATEAGISLSEYVLAVLRRSRGASV